jgi:hypothetical protein
VRVSKRERERERERERQRERERERERESYNIFLKSFTTLHVAVFRVPSEYVV